MHLAWVTDRDADAYATTPTRWCPVKGAHGASSTAASDASRALETLEYLVDAVAIDDDGIGISRVESITVRPKAAAPRALPTIILPHGGPHAACGAGYVATVAYLASLGYAVVYCNYRGSTGYGEDFLQARSVSHWFPYDRVRVVDADP